MSSLEARRGLGSLIPKHYSRVRPGTRVSRFLAAKVTYGIVISGPGAGQSGAGPRSQLVSAKVPTARLALSFGYSPASLGAVPQLMSRKQVPTPGSERETRGDLSRNAARRRAARDALRLRRRAAHDVMTPAPPPLALEFLCNPSSRW